MASEVKTLFEGSWSCYKRENVEAVLEKLRIPESNWETWISVDTTVCNIKVEGEDITISGKTGQHGYYVTFKLGEDFEVGAEHIEKGNTVFADGELTTTLVLADPSLPREVMSNKIADGVLVQKVEVDGAVCKRYFRKS